MAVAKVSKYWLGHVPSAADPRGWKVGALLGVGGSSPPTVSSGVAKWASDPLDQGQTSSCVGHGIAEQLYCLMGREGVAQVMPSPLEIYYNARAEDGEQDRDEGSRPRSAYSGIQRWGYCAYKDWPTELVGPLQQPPWKVMRLSVDHDDINYYGCDTAGELLVYQVKAALAEGYPIGFAMPVDQSYMDYTGGVWKGMKSASLGGHFQCALEYDADGVWVQNSWGKGWGDSGRCHIVWNVVQTVWTDVYAATYASSAS